MDPRRRTFLQEAADHAERAQQVIDAALERARAHVIDLRDPAPAVEDGLPGPREPADDGSRAAPAAPQPRVGEDVDAS